MAHAIPEIAGQKHYSKREQRLRASPTAQKVLEGFEK